MQMILKGDYEEANQPTMHASAWVAVNPQRIQIRMSAPGLHTEALGWISGSKKEKHCLNWDKHTHSSKHATTAVRHNAWHSLCIKEWLPEQILPFQYNVFSTFLFYFHHDHLKEQLLCTDRSQHIKRHFKEQGNWKQLTTCRQKIRMFTKHKNMQLT